MSHQQNRDTEISTAGSLRHVSSIPWLYLPEDAFVPGVTCGQLLDEIDLRIQRTHEGSGAWRRWLDPRLRRSTRLRLASDYLRSVEHSALRARISIEAGVRFGVVWLAFAQAMRVFEDEPAVWTTLRWPLGAGLMTLAFSGFVYWSLSTTALDTCYKVADEMQTRKRNAGAS